MEQIKKLLVQYKGIILYIIFGALATFINIGVYWLCCDLWGFSTALGNAIAWVAAVIVAFITNKLWVFESKSTEKKVLLYETVSFFGCRLGTFFVDEAMMIAGVDWLGINGPVMKIAANIVVVILNYVASKLWIFKKKDTEQNKGKH